MSPPPIEIVNPAQSGRNVAAFDAVVAHAKQTFTAVYVTVFIWDRRLGLLRRIYSTSPAICPVGGTKKMQTDAEWPQTVLVRGQPHFCRNGDEIEATFSDWRAMIDVGVDQQLSVPFVDTDDGTVFGALNLCGEKDAYDGETVREVQKLVAANAGTMRDYWRQSGEL